jgi:hypothetical protein
VRVEFLHEADTPPFVSFASEAARPQPLHYKLTIQMINDGEASVWVTGLFVEEPNADLDGGAGYELLGGVNRDDTRSSHASACRFRSE